MSDVVFVSIFIGGIVLLYLLVEISVRTFLKSNSLFFTDWFTPLFGFVLNSIIFSILASQVDSILIIGIFQGALIIAPTCLALTIVKLVLYYAPSQKIQIRKDPSK
ncbi:MULTISPECIES: hypothetical protein [Shouchella]|uniref:Uncharacterized protein n=1 Tax=Shouchella lehensis TaxID=300825 RepID=A0A4Y7WF96_9BACI|nr:MULTISPECIES: hypothetical protein [Shouchella]MBG9785030.1 hypothetical protein [Shouchella lehensis]TES46454.1 hypothetical protein E2L03_17305 [Shouchella lehensis]